MMLKFWKVNLDRYEKSSRQQTMEKSAPSKQKCVQYLLVRQIVNLAPSGVTQTEKNGPAK